MRISLQKFTVYRDKGKCGTILFTVLMIIALVLMPYRFHASSGTFGKSAAFAKDGGGDDGGDDGGGSSGDDGGGSSGGDDGGASSGGDDGGLSSGGDDSGGHGDDGGSGHHDVDSSGHEGGEHHGAAGESDADSGHGDSAGDGPGALIGAGGLQGLSAVSAEEEAGLVGNWGGQSNPAQK